MFSAFDEMLRKAACALFLGLFVFGVAGDPVTDLLFPHQGTCEVCAALAGGHGIAAPAAGPELAPVLGVTADAAGTRQLPPSRVLRPHFLSRAPPAV